MREEQVYTYDTSYQADEGDLPVYALDRASGSPVWTTKIGLRNNWEPQGPYAVAGRENIFVTVGEVEIRMLGRSTNRTNTPEVIAAIDTDSGAITWQWRLERELAPMAYAEGYLFVPAWDVETKRAALHALNVQNGTIAWSYQTDSGRIGAPTVTPDRVYFSQGSELVGLSVADGSNSMRLSFEDEIENFSSPETPHLGNPIIANVSIYLLVGTPGQPNQSVVYCVRRPAE